MELTKKEIKTLNGILRTEIRELKDLVKTVDDEKDKKELEKELEIVKSIFSKINEKTDD